MIRRWKALPWQHQVVVQGAAIGVGIFTFGAAVGSLAYRTLRGD